MCVRSVQPSVVLFIFFFRQEYANTNKKRIKETLAKLTAL